jgi:hypothetical protein
VDPRRASSTAGYSQGDSDRSAWTGGTPPNGHRTTGRTDRGRTGCYAHTRSIPDVGGDTSPDGHRRANADRRGHSSADGCTDSGNTGYAGYDSDGRENTGRTGAHGNCHSDSRDPGRTRAHGNCRSNGSDSGRTGAHGNCRSDRSDSSRSDLSSYRCRDPGYGSGNSGHSGCAGANGNCRSDSSNSGDAGPDDDRCSDPDGNGFGRRYRDTGAHRISDSGRTGSTACPRAQGWTPPGLAHRADCTGRGSSGGCRGVPVEAQATLIQRWSDGCTAGPGGSEPGDAAN